MKKNNPTYVKIVAAVLAGLMVLSVITTVITILVNVQLRLKQKSRGRVTVPCSFFYFVWEDRTLRSYLLCKNVLLVYTVKYEYNFCTNENNKFKTDVKREYYREKRHI